MAAFVPRAYDAPLFGYRSESRGGSGRDEAMATTSLASDEVAIPGRRALGPTRLGDLLELAKPRLTAMVVVTAGVGFILGSGPGLTLGALGRLVAAVTG
ncbi:MAG: hypothetical protein ACE5GW_09940, partial [Planctomycetota bacterium]